MQGKPGEETLKRAHTYEKVCGRVRAHTSTQYTRQAMAQKAHRTPDTTQTRAHVPEIRPDQGWCRAHG